MWEKRIIKTLWQIFIFWFRTFPVNISWSSRHALKTYSTCLQRSSFSSILKTSRNTSWRPSRGLQKIFEDKKLLRWRRLEDVLKTCHDYVLKIYIEDAFKKCLDDVFKTCLEHVFKTPWRQTKYLLEISISNESKSVSSKSIYQKSISDESKGNPTCIN